MPHHFIRLDGVRVGSWDGAGSMKFDALIRVDDIATVFADTKATTEKALSVIGLRSGTIIEADGYTLRDIADLITCVNMANAQRAGGGQ